MQVLNASRKRIQIRYFTICAIVGAFHLATSSPSISTKQWLLEYLSMLSSVVTVIGLPYLLYTLGKERPFKQQR